MKAALLVVLCHVALTQPLLPNRGPCERLHNYFMTVYGIMHRDSVVGIVTRYGLGGPGIESRWM